MFEEVNYLGNQITDLFTGGKHNLLVCPTKDFPKSLLCRVGNQQVSSSVCLVSIILGVDGDRGPIIVSLITEEQFKLP